MTPLNVNKCDDRVVTRWGRTGVWVLWDRVDAFDYSDAAASDTGSPRLGLMAIPVYLVALLPHVPPAPHR